MQPPPLSISRTFSSPHSGTLYPWNNNSPFPPCPGHHHSTSCFYEFAYSRYLLSVESNSIYPHVSVWLLSFSKMFSRYIHVNMLQNFLPFQGWITFHCMWVGGISNTRFSLKLWPFKLRLENVSLSQNQQIPGSRVVIHTFHLEFHLFLMFFSPFCLLLFSHLCFHRLSIFLFFKMLIFMFCWFFFFFLKIGRASCRERV